MKTLHACILSGGMIVSASILFVGMNRLGTSVQLAGGLARPPRPPSQIDVKFEADNPNRPILIKEVK
ncbi:MAG: hypothetical protein H7A49_03735 [Akkermansiaceae bacterium]|nr:hypothetical protein [Akkermansiaceae bacterium]MCP5547709.1 hypothetical protein [Akkermansiaceae bacterium]